MKLNTSIRTTIAGKKVLIRPDSPTLEQDINALDKETRADLVDRGVLVLGKAAAAGKGKRKPKGADSNDDDTDSNDDDKAPE